MLIRNFRPDDAPLLRTVFYASVHQLAARNYTPEQREAWAPLDHDAAQWAARLQANQPFVAELDGAVAGFADLQDSGYIDQFFVAPACAGRGVAKALMAHIEASAARRGITALFADVSLTAEPFFSVSGFTVEQRQQVERQGVVLRNARMGKALATAHR
ncbi:MAG: GNAT family N-acetyltransferase [Pseudomonadota bacterium]|uniref:GNAT family N-acetyltransferase n=1 Tax=Brevundimonas sp. TaxID=1871086 RepID=UPI0027306D57|nr:GNAT family N-acetyltransferase [Brevundimonas sp.]MDP1912334.1 GNAT family N-acetyltransferase [Brevundimonas sp.]